MSADYEWIKFKVVIVDDEAGGVIVASSQEVEIRNKKIESAKYIKNISLNFLRNNKNKKFILDETAVYTYQESYINEECDIIDDLKEILTDEEIYILLEHLIYGKKLIDLASEFSITFVNMRVKYHRIIKKCKKGVNIK